MKLNLQNSHRTPYSIAWDKICTSKCEGGSGIKKTEDVNVVFLAKQR